MTEPFVLRSADIQTGRDACWVVHPPQDPYGDGYVYEVATELSDSGMTAATIANVEGVYVRPAILRLPAFLEVLAADWRGWSGVRSWRSLDPGLALDAQHDGRGYVSLGVTLQAPRLDLNHTAWSARTVFVLEAGEEMAHAAADLAHLIPG
jgi:hypothetical protein